jgi:hypothetical protein
MAYESIDVSGLKSALDQVSEKSNSSKSKLLTSIEGFDDSNWKSNVRESVIFMSNQIGDRFSKLDNAVASYKAILDLILEYQTKTRELKEARQRYSEYKSLYDYYSNQNIPIYSAIQASIYSSKMSKEYENVTTLVTKTNNLHKQIEGSRI